MATPQAWYPQRALPTLHRQLPTHTALKEIGRSTQNSQRPHEKTDVNIASQLIEFSEGDGVDVILGGGSAYFLPKNAGGKRNDGRNLIGEWEKKYRDAKLVNNRKELLSISDDTEKLLGLFHTVTYEFR